MSPEPPDVVTAIVCTRNRPESLTRAVDSLLRPGAEALELIVVDQSDGAQSQEALSGFADDPRFRYIRSQARGKGAALNEGIRLARGAIVVCTDDDCIAPPGWIMAMARALESQATAVVVFCNVEPIPYDTKLGYVPKHEVKENRLLRSLSAVCKTGLGIGAGMALRRDFAMGMGGFDETFGPGARFPSADDWDIGLRALLTGKHVYETSEISIVHDGFRTMEEGRKHVWRDSLALGAVFAKPLRAGHAKILIVAIWVFSTRAIWPPIADALRLRRPRGVVRIAGFLQGFSLGLRMTVDRKTLRFCSAPGK
jgi:glycosyltransferase involved in cell wall biosynthesis